MNGNAEVIFMLCSQLQTDMEYTPYAPSEWSKLAEKLMRENLQPSDLPEMSDTDLCNYLDLYKNETERMRYLFQRRESLFSVMEKYRNTGISVVTRADILYPKMLKIRLGKRCPPLFYVSGNLQLASRKAIGFVGSRNADKTDQRFTEDIVFKMNHLGYSVVSGGAKGVDEIAVSSAIRNSSSAVVYIADSLVRRIRNRNTLSAIRNHQLLLLSATNPDTEFTAGTAMMRNRYIYAHSLGTVVVRSDDKKGGTWNGAADCLRHEICPVFCWNHTAYHGNQELIKLGAIPVAQNWNGDITQYDRHPEDELIQLTLFD